MLDVSESARQTIQSTTSNEFFAAVEMEVELNGYLTYDLEFPESLEPSIFPNQSVMLPRRPEGGLPKMIAGSGRALSTSIPGLVYSKDKVWYRTPTKDSKYKYFRSKELSGEEEISGAYPFVTPLEFTATYTQSRMFNFIVVGFEYATSIPHEALVEVYSNGEWDAIGTFSPNEIGLVEVFYNGSWSQGRSASQDFTSFSGIRVTIAGMDAPGAAVELIQISPRLLLDLTDRVVDVTLSHSRDSVELNSPVGTSGSNVASLDLENTDGFFNNENELSVLKGLIDVNIKLNIQSIVTLQDDVEIVPQMSVYVNSWEYQAQGQVVVECSDFSKILQSQRLDNTFYQNKDIRFVIVDIIERAGVVDYEIRYAESDSFNRIPYVYFDEESTVWQVLQQIATAEQAVFYFDESNTFVWESRDYLWQDTEPDLVLSGSARGESLPNIVDYSVSHQVVANIAKVYYTPTDLLRYGEELNTNFLWELDEETVLVASPLLNDIDQESSFILISDENYDLMPEEGIVNIDAEFIKYSKTPPDQFDGEDLERVLYITERGVFNSQRSSHYVDTDEDYWKFETYWPGVGEDDFLGEDEFIYLDPVFESQGVSGFAYTDESQLIINSTRSNIRNYAQFVSKDENTVFDVYGAQLKFPMFESINFEPSYDGDGIAGIVFNMKSDETYPYQGYYVEVVSSDYARSSADSKREIRILKIVNQLEDPVLLAGYFDSDLDLSIDEVQDVFGAELLVFPGSDYKLEVLLKRNIVIVEGEERQSVTITVIVDGRRILSHTDIESESNPVYVDGSWGVYARGNTEVNFEYIYAINRRGDTTRLFNSQTAIRDRVRGGFIDNTLESFLTEFNSLRNDFVFEDFGSWIREVKEFDVKHDIFPAISTHLFVSNDNDTYLIYYRRDQFSSKFAIGNRIRDFVFLSGDDPRSDLKMTLAVYGVPIEEKEQNEEERRDEPSVFRRGELEVLVDSRWIQSKRQAEKIGDWIVSRWGSPLEFISAEIAFDPRIQLGDVLSIDMPENDLYEETNRFHVVAMQKSIGSQTSLSLTLRRFET